MKSVWLLACVAVLFSHVAVADTTVAEPLRLSDAAAMKDAADSLARCAGIYRGVAEVMRTSGREQQAAYAESVGFGALFAAYLLLTSPAAIDADVLDSVDPLAKIEALAWGSERNFVMMNEQAEEGIVAAVRACKQTAELQSSLLLGAVPVLARADR
jgi:hypothetical protein